MFSVEIRKGKSVDSEIHDNLVIDFNRSGKIIRINLYDFSFDAFQESEEMLREFAKARNTTLVVAC